MPRDHDATTACLTSRRQVLAGLSALGASTMLPGVAAAQASDAARIDVHHHFFPPQYLEPLAEWGRHNGFGGLQAPQREWSIARAVAEMDRTGTAAAVLSISTPGIWFGEKEQARSLARLCNDYAAQMGRDNKGRFGLFAAVPMPDVEGTLREIEYALDVLKADGIGLMTSYSDNSGSKWLGNPTYLPVFTELNRRKAIVFVHPTVPSCCPSLLPDVAPLVAEIPQDTARAITNLLFTGSLSRFRGIRFIFAHAGGSVPMLLGRMHQYAPKD